MGLISSAIPDVTEVVSANVTVPPSVLLTNVELFLAPLVLCITFKSPVAKTEAVVTEASSDPDRPGFPI